MVTTHDSIWIEPCEIFQNVNEMMALKRDWTVVVFTVPFRLTCKSFRHRNDFNWLLLILSNICFILELNLLRSKGIISCDHPVLVIICSLFLKFFIKDFKLTQNLKVVDDPTENIGSGGATLNALLVAAEYLSACQGNTVLTPDVLKDAKILVVHMVRFQIRQIKTIFNIKYVKGEKI